MPSVAQSTQADQPLQLRRTIYARLDHLFAYPNARPGQLGNVYQTLADANRFPEAVAALELVDTVDRPKGSLPTVIKSPTKTPEEHLSGKETV